MLVYESRSKDLQKPIATVVITKVSSDTSILTLAPGSASFSLQGLSGAAAILSKKGTPFLKVHVDKKDSTLIQRIEALGLCIIKGASIDAHIAISLHSAKGSKQLRFDVVDNDLLGLKDAKLDLKSRFIDDTYDTDSTDRDLAHVIKGLAHYYFHLKRTSDSFKGSIDKVSVSFFQVLDAGSGYPRVDKLVGAENLYRNNVIDIDVTAKSGSDPDAIYGFEITNNTDKGKILHPVLFYFDNTEFTICE